MDATSYELSRQFFDWSYENPEKISPNHIALYFFIVEHCNRLGWKDKFGLPTEMAKEAIGIRNYRTFYKALNDLIEFGFIKLIEKSKNQYSSNIIAIVKNTKAHTKAYDKARQKQIQKQGKSTVDIIKPENKLTLNPEQYESIFDFKKSFLNLGVQENIINDWLKVRKAKKGVNTETSFNAIKKEIDISQLPANDCIRICVEKNWVGFKAEWLQKSGIKPTEIKSNGEINLKDFNIPTKDYFGYSQDDLLELCKQGKYQRL